MRPEPGYVLSPDCTAGKHRACSGDAWDVVADEGTGCECDCHPYMRVTDEEVTP